jgi:hypothetical protein
MPSSLPLYALPSLQDANPCSTTVCSANPAHASAGRGLNRFGRRDPVLELVPKSETSQAQGSDDWERYLCQQHVTSNVTPPIKGTAPMQAFGSRTCFLACHRLFALIQVDPQPMHFKEGHIPIFVCLQLRWAPKNTRI